MILSDKYFKVKIQFLFNNDIKMEYDIINAYSYEECSSYIKCFSKNHIMDVYSQSFLFTDYKIMIFNCSAEKYNIIKPNFIIHLFTGVIKDRYRYIKEEK